MPKPPKQPSKKGRGPEHLFHSWATVARRIHSARVLVLFLDFDGTLVPLRQKPKEVFLDRSVRRLLNRLAAHPRVVLCFISGRQLSDLRQRTGVEGALYFGLHGWERSNGKPGLIQGVVRLHEARRWLEGQVRGLTGIRIEDKGVCFGVHYRGAPDSSIKQTKIAVEKTMARLGSDFRLMAGKKIWEIYPKDMGTKGTAVQDLLKQIPGRKLTIYAGDDATDETAFAQLRGGVTIHVGDAKQTHANFFLEDPSEVLMFLKKLEGAIG